MQNKMILQAVDLLRNETIYFNECGQICKIAPVLPNCTARFIETNDVVFYRNIKVTGCIFANMLSESEQQIFEEPIKYQISDEKETTSESYKYSCKK